MRGFGLMNPNKKIALFLHGWNDEGSKGWVQEMLLGKFNIVLQQLPY